MKYEVKEITIKDLLELIEKRQVDLKPPYQRNFIWSKNDQTYLIDSILKGYPLPNFFVYHKPDGSYEMVDGQQRTRTIHRFSMGIISASNKSSINDIDKELFFSYKLNWSIISSLDKGDSLEDFYVLVNKRSKHLNPSEISKAEFHDTKLLALVEELLDLQEMIDLDLFSESTIKRMNDRSFVEELVAYLKVGITDKKHIIEKIYQIDITDQEFNELRDKYVAIIRRIAGLNKIKSINKTRYRQKNDFYTLFNFINENLETANDLLIHQYKLLLLIGPYISPSNEDCQPLKEYAINCVSQSNSKNARQSRLDFFNEVLKNLDITANKTLRVILDFLEFAYPDKKIDFVEIDGFQLVDIKPFEKSILEV